MKLCFLAPHRVHAKLGMHASAHPRKDVGICDDIQHMCGCVFGVNFMGNQIGAAIIAKDLALGEGGKASIIFLQYNLKNVR